MGQAPPPFYGPPPPRQGNSGVIVAVVIGSLLVVFGFCAFGLYSAFSKMGGIMQQTMGMFTSELACQENFAATRRAVLDYAKNHDGKFPEAAHWQDDVRMYLRRELSHSSFSDMPQFGPTNPQNAPKPMSADGQWGCATSTGSTGMSYNSDLSGKRVADVKDPDDTILIYEIPTPESNASGPYKAPPEPQVRTQTGFRSWKIEYVHEDENQERHLHGGTTTTTGDDDGESSNSGSKSKSGSNSSSSSDDSDN